jgi:hypothetical protein
MIWAAASRSKEKERLWDGDLVLFVFVFVFRGLTILPLVVHNAILFLDARRALGLVDLRGSLRALRNRVKGGLQC